jgi:hypothetical protein
VFFLALPPLANLVLRDKADLPGLTIVVPLLVAMLIAELLATLRPVSGVRIASLDPRGWRDLVPRWSVVAMAVLAVLAVVWSVAGLVIQPWSISWLALGYAATALLLTTLLVRLAVRRPAVEDAAVDAALRTRTARVAVGIGIGWLGAAVPMAVERVRFLHDVAALPVPDWLDSAGDIVTPAALVGAILCWLWVANPTRRSLTSARA